MPAYRLVSDRAFLAAINRRPSLEVRELGEAVGLRSSASVHARLVDLQANNLLTRGKCQCCGSMVWQLTAQGLEVIGGNQSDQGSGLASRDR